MTDKQIPNERRQYEYKSVYPEKSIIIDGVDVSGCEFYFGGCCGVNGYMDCAETPSCYYKRLKLTEQKLERIAKVCDKFIPDHFKILLIINGGTVEE